MAWAVHFNDPSGQYANGQLCSGRAVPVAARSARFFADFSLPRGQGVPHVTPCGIAGAWSSQRTQLPAAGLAPAGAGTEPCAGLVAMASTALVAAPVERKARREIRLLIASPLIERARL